MAPYTGRMQWFNTAKKFESSGRDGGSNTSMHYSPTEGNSYTQLETEKVASLPPWKDMIRPALTHNGCLDHASAPHSILLYSSDFSLLYTRRWPLERAGYRVLGAGTLAETERMVTAEPISLFLVCHSVSVEDREKALISACDKQPEIKLLLLTRADTPPCSENRNARLLSSHDGPGALVAAVHELLAANLH